MGSLETLSRLKTVSRQYFHCLGLGLGLEGYCLGLGLGLECSILVSCLVETFIKTVVTFVIVGSKNIVPSFVILSVN